MASVDWEKAARRAARKYGVREDVFVAQIRQESGGVQGRTSKAGARDIAQFIPSTAKQYGVTLGDGRIGDDLDGAARYMRDNLKATGGDYHAALSLYNSGRADGYKHIAETANYVKTILGGLGATVSKGGSSRAPGSTRTTSSTRSVTVPGQTSQDVEGAIVDALLAHRGIKGAMANLDSGRYTSTTPDTIKTVTDRSTTRAAGASAKGAKAAGMSPLLELFWQGPDGIDVKDGKKVPQGFVSGHADHVHVAAGPKTIVQLGKVAQEMGLHVGENSHFGKVNPVHVTHSYHYKDQAIDVSGPAEVMAKFAHRVASTYGIK